jgi:hypothetical protein
MDQRHQLAEQLEARAVKARSLAEAQALTAEADRLRGTRPAPTASPGWTTQLIRN